MKINDFPVAISVDLTRRSQRVICRLRLVSDTQPEVTDAARAIVGKFADACNFGMLAGNGSEPETARMDIHELPPAADALEFELAFTNVRATSCRVLMGMFRGEVLIDGGVTGVDITSQMEPAGRPLPTVTDEQKLPLPGLIDRLSFRYDRQEAVRNADRGIRVTFARPLQEDVVTHLERVQAAWEAVCEGGCCSAGMQAVECGTLCHPGVTIAPNIFEVKIGIFRNPDICFDYFANAMERVSSTILRVDRMEVW